jgi:hypothetical protein
MEISAIKEAILGPECDAELLARLKSAVLAAKGTMSEASYVVAGSQEIITYGIALPDGELTATSETYVGLSIKGPAQLVKQLEYVRGA